MKRISLLLCTILCVTFSLTNAQELSKECLKKYLSDHGEKEDVLDYVDKFSGSVPDCKSAIRKKLETIYDNLRNKLKDDRKIKTYVDCIMGDIEEEDEYEKFEISSLKEVAVGMISNWRFWAYFSKTSRLEEIQNERQSYEDDLVKKSLIKCKGHREFGDLFSNINDQTILWTRTGEQEYCIRKVLVEKGYLNSREYQLILNPRNVRIATFEPQCGEIFKNVIDDFYDKLKAHESVIRTDDTNDCFIAAYRKHEYAENILKAEVLAKLKLNRSDKTKERQNFINNLVDIMNQAKDC